MVRAIEGQASTHHRLAEIPAAEHATHHHAIARLGLLLALAAHVPAATNQFLQLAACFITTWPCLSVAARASLIGFEGVDAVQTDRKTGDHKVIAVLDAGDAANVHALHILGEDRIAQEQQEASRDEHFDSGAVHAESSCLISSRSLWNGVILISQDWISPSDGSEVLSRYLSGVPPVVVPPSNDARLRRNHWSQGPCDV